MPVKRNPKQVGSNLWDCIPQSGKCPLKCNQCFFNRPGAFYTDTPIVPMPEEVGEGIVRMNCGHDSGIEKGLVVETARQYKHAFFNTSIPDFNWPRPYVFTANRMEEIMVYAPPTEDDMTGLMFIRLRVSGTNLELVKKGVQVWTKKDIPVVLTFMAYYDGGLPLVDDSIQMAPSECYEWKVRHVNSYYCPTPAFMEYVMKQFRGNRLVTMCGGLNSNLCKDCRNCETYYWQAEKRLRGE